MTPHQRTLEAAGRTRRTLYIITAVYVVIGFTVAIPAALSGDRLSAFLGFLIIGGALAAAAVVGAVLRLTARVLSVSESVEMLSESLERIEQTIEAAQNVSLADPGIHLIDLASVGDGDPSVLAAARLDRDLFPRLVATMERQPPSETPIPDAPIAPADVAGGDDATETRSGTSADEIEPSGVTTKNLLREWRLGLRNGDLAACRAVYATLIDMAQPAALAPMKLQLDQLADRTEASLRDTFSRNVAARDFAGMLKVGEQICRLLPERPVADEFMRVRPHLLHHLEQTGGSDTHPTLRVVQ